MAGTGRFAIGAAAAVTLVLAGCGGSDGGGDIDAFCEQIRAIDAADEAVDDDLAAAEEFEVLIDDAPDEMKNDLRIVADAFAELDEDGPEAFEQFFELLQRPEFVDATETLEQFGVDECGLAPSTDTEPPGEVLSEEPDDAEEVVGVDVESIGDDSDDGSVKTTTVPGDPYDEEFWGPIDPDEISIPGIEQHLDVNYPDEGWFEGSVNGSSLSDGVVVVFANLEGDDAVRLCDAVLEYAGAIDPDVSVRVEDEASTVGAAGTVAEGCA